MINNYNDKMVRVYPHKILVPTHYKIYQAYRRGDSIYNISIETKQSIKYVKSVIKSLQNKGLL